MSFDFEPETQSSILGFRRPFKAFAGVGKLLERSRLKWKKIILVTWLSKARWGYVDEV